MFRPAEFVDHLEGVLPFFDEAVEEQVLVDRSFKAALGAGTIVARDVDEDGIVGIGQLLHRIDDAAHFIVALRPVGGEHFHHTGIKALLVRVECVPGD